MSGQRLRLQPPGNVEAVPVVSLGYKTEKLYLTAANATKR